MTYRRHITGFCRRLSEEVQFLTGANQRYEQLRPLVAQSRLCIVKDVLCPRNILTWVGGSILAILEVSENEKSVYHHPRAFF